jgi:hypothetical protein
MFLNLGRKNRPFNERPSRDVVQVGRDTDSALSELRIGRLYRFRAAAQKVSQLRFGNAAVGSALRTRGRFRARMAAFLGRTRPMKPKIAAKAAEIGRFSPRFPSAK